MATLLVDIGNTALMDVWADGMTLGRTSRYQGEKIMDFILSLISAEKPEVLVLSSVRSFSAADISVLKENTYSFHSLWSDFSTRSLSIERTVLASPTM